MKGEIIMGKWVRLIAMAVAIVATVALESIQGVNESWEWVSLISAFILAVWNAWKNNDFTFAAKVGTKVMNAIKDGKITADEVKEFLDTKDE
jgi:uncharacterized protein with gpF-like domain